MSLRRLIRLARSPRVREGALRLAVAWALLAPILLVAFDHHGVERLPNHTHVTGGGAAHHLHGFEIAHEDRPGTPQTAPGEPVLAAPDSPAALVMASAQAVSLPGPRTRFAPPAVRAGGPVETRPLVDQTALDPPTQPPELAAA